MNNDSVEYPLWTPQPTLHPSSWLIYQEKDGSVLDNTDSQQALAMMNSTNVAVMNSQENNTLGAEEYIG